MKRNTSSVAGFIVVALYNRSNTFITAAAMKISRSHSKRLAGNLPWTRVKFPVASNRMEGTKFEVSL